MKVKEIELHEIIPSLPDLKDFDDNQFTNEEYDFYLCALGFEDRCTAISKKLESLKNFKVRKSIIFEYFTNKTDNEANLPELLQAVKTFSESYDRIPCDDDSFPNSIRSILKSIEPYKKDISIILDISVCSQKVILNILKVLFEYNIRLKLVYAEALVYHPTNEEFEKDPSKWTSEEGLGLTKGVYKVIPSPEHPGTVKVNPNLVIIFPTFKPERAKKIISEIDETLLLISPNDRIIWIVGDPNMDEENRRKRIEIIKNINQISASDYCIEVSTLDYKKTLGILNQIVEKIQNYHINIAILGSKMQSIGIFLFWYIRKDLSLYFTIPEVYNPNQYSEKCKNLWMIDFGQLDDIRHSLNRVGTLEVLKEIK